MPRVLIADDNSSVQNNARDVLKGQGIEVVTVSNGDHAVQKLADTQPDLVLADIFMPGYNGYEVCQFIKNDERFAHIPVILLYGKFDPLDDREVKRVQADDVLQKPFKPPDPLIAKVKSALEKAAQKRRAAESRQAAQAGMDEFAAAVPQAEETQQLSQEEIATLTGQPPKLEPEPIEQFATQPQRIEFGEGEQPLAFGDLLGPESAQAAEEAPSETKAPAFRASSITRMEALEALTAKEPPATEPAEGVPRAEAVTEAPSYDIQEPLREPSPEEPPIKVDFGAPSEPLELVRDEPAVAPPLEPAGAPELVGAGEWAAPAVATPAPPGAPAEQQAESAVAFDIPSMAAAEQPPTPVPISPPPVIPPPPAETPAPPVSSAAAALEAAFSIPPIPEPIIEPTSTPSGLAAVELPGLKWSAEPAPAETPEPVAEPPSEAPSPVPAPAQLLDAEQLQDLVNKVVGSVSPQIAEQVTREVLRRLGEALNRPDFGKN